ncbi:MAG: metallophosphoesterase [Patescibacteria group bacterium]
MSAVFFIIIFVSLVILFLAHLAVYKSLVTIFALSSQTTLLSLKIFLIVFGVAFVFAMLLASKYNNFFTRIFYTISASWYGILFYLLLAVAIYAILSAIFGNLLPTSISILGKSLVVFALVVSVYGLWNAGHLSFTRYDVSIPNLSSSWLGKKAIWISDVHLDQVHNVEYSSRIALAIKKENPDIVFIGGDLYDGVKIDEAAAIAPFKELHPSLGVYFITGNHEEFGDNAHYVDAVKAAGIRILNNEMINLEGLNIIGVDDRDSTQKDIFENILIGLKIQKGAPTILLKHQPFQLDIAEKFGVSLQISGHTHRAQMYPLSLVTKLIYRGYDYGQKQYGNMQIIVSDGVGTWGPPLRVGTKSEIVVLNFK